MFESFAHKEIEFEGFKLGFESALILNQAQTKSLVDCCRQNQAADIKVTIDSKSTNKLLTGRGQVHRINLQGLGNLIVKPYLRGGILRFFNKRTYLKFSSSSKFLRAKHEFNVLQNLSKLGINCPEAVCYLWIGRFFYKNWLVTREIVNSQTLAQLAVSNPDLARSTMISVVDQVALLIKHNIFHEDLHPGNVIIDQQQKVYLIDFDKAQKVSISIDVLRDQYIQRWRRAIHKYDLPEFLVEAFCLGLKSINNENLDSTKRCDR